jgi:hypothetical protein
VYLHFKNIIVKGSDPVTIGDKTFRFQNTSDVVINGEKAIRIMDKGFVTSKEYKKGAAVSSAPGQRIYNVII